MSESDHKIVTALRIIGDYRAIDGGHHKQWVLDQVVRILTDCPTETKTKPSKDCNGEDYIYEGLGKSDKYRIWCYENDWGKENEGIAP